jgi:hypothetical protein
LTVTTKVNAGTKKPSDFTITVSGNSPSPKSFSGSSSGTSVTLNAGKYNNNNEWKKGIKHSEYESIRELAVFSKKEGLNLSEMASRFRLYNYIRKMFAVPGPNPA